MLMRLNAVLVAQMFVGPNKMGPKNWAVLVICNDHARNWITVHYFDREMLKRQSTTLSQKDVGPQSSYFKSEKNVIRYNSKYTRVYPYCYTDFTQAAKLGTRNFFSTKPRHKWKSIVARLPAGMGLLVEYGRPIFSTSMREGQIDPALLPSL